MTDLRIIQLIETNLTVRGLSRGEQDAGELCRRVTQYWDMQGNLVFEYDPCPDGKSHQEGEMIRYRDPA
jgi:hypothetical protein